MTDGLYKCDYCWRERTHVDEAGGCYCPIHYREYFATGPRKTAGEANETMTKTYLSRFGYVGNPVEEHHRSPLRKRNAQCK